MKLSESTVEVLKNFATINQSILFTDGKELNTVAVQKNLLGSATVAETFKSPNGEFAIYDLNEFLSTLSLFEDPDVEFGEQFATISDSRANTVRQRRAKPWPNRQQRCARRNLDYEESKQPNYWSHLH